MHLKKVAIISRSSSDFPELQKDLKKTGIDIYTVSSIQEIIGRYMNSQFVLAIINEDSYGEQTPELVRYLHGAKPAPILVMMAKSCHCTRLELLRLGATACLDAEASPQEQAAQAKALIQMYDARDDNLHRKTLAFGTSLVINPIYHLVILNGNKINLTRREFDLLYFMARHERQLFTPEQLYRQLSGDDDDTQIGDTVKSAIKALRKKLEPAGHEYIQNEWGAGYRFVGNAENL